MKPGIIYQDRYSLELNPSFDAPTALHVLIGVELHHADGSYDSIAPTNSKGTAIPDVVLPSGVAYPHDVTKCTSPDVPKGPTASIGGFALMWTKPITAQAAPGDSVPVEIIWDRMGPTDTNWTVFVHLFDADGNKITQADSPPLNNFYPTSLWQRPYRVLDTHILHLPADLKPGDYRVFVGMYNANDPAFTRAVAADASGTPFPDFAVPFSTFKVVVR
jgi:hypothetical protein